METKKQRELLLLTGYRPDFFIGKWTSEDIDELIYTSIYKSNKKGERILTPIGKRLANHLLEKFIK